MEKLLDKNFVNDLKLDGTFNEDSFDREYESIWSGSFDNSFFSADVFKRNRIVHFAEHEYSNKTSKDGYYVMGVDVGRFGCSTEVIVMKVQPIAGTMNKSKTIVNIYTFEEEHFGLQAIHLKRIFNKFKCKCAVVDGNGLGAGLIDMLVMEQLDPDTGEVLYPWGVLNDEEGRYSQFKTADTIQNAMYIMKATKQINSDLYSFLQIQMQQNLVRFLITTDEAKQRIADKKMTPDKRAEYLVPYSLTNVLFDQMMNLVRTENKMDSSGCVVLTQVNSRVKKDKVSALIYALAYCFMFDDNRNKRKKNSDVSKYMIYTAGQ